MIAETGEMLKISLDGDWSMSGVSEKFPVLAEYVANVLNAETSGDQQKSLLDSIPEIDLAGVTDFDACGCQLLALFVRNLRQNGVSAQLINMPDTFRSKARFLGFDRELNLPL